MSTGNRRMVLFYRRHRDTLGSPNAFELACCRRLLPTAYKSLLSATHTNRTVGPLMIGATKGVNRLRRANLFAVNNPRRREFR